MEPLDGWTSGAPGTQMCVRAYGCRVSVVDVRVSRACARGERLLGGINIIVKHHPLLIVHTALDFGSICAPAFYYSGSTGTVD